MRSSNRIRVITSFIASFIVIGIALTIQTGNVIGPMIIPSVSVSIVNETFKAHVSPDDDGIVRISGTVGVNDQWMEEYGDLKIDLAIFGTEWNYTITDDIVLTEESPSHEIEIDIYVPIGMSLFESTVTIGGFWLSEKGDQTGIINSDEVFINTVHYYRFSLVAENNKIMISEGESVGFRCRIINEGNGDDRVKVNIANHEELALNGLSVSLSQDKYQLEEDSERVLHVAVTVDAGIYIGYQIIQIEAYSAQAESLGDIGFNTTLELVLNPHKAPSNTTGSNEESPGLGIYSLVSIGLLSVIVIHIKRKSRKY
ncbi:MAG: hypothetical protein KAH57_10370 [Thermoplasmata archaeon]|nr:hypothetical protein [Thermoplasmata archaeon]